MKESHIEGVAIHDGPESCVGARKGDGEALTGVRAGRDMEPRNHIDRGADAVHVSGCGTMSTGAAGQDAAPLPED